MTSDCTAKFQAWVVATNEVSEARRAVDHLIESMNVLPGQEILRAPSGPAWDHFMAARAREWERFKELTKCWRGEAD
jgi:hypothetical protein